MTNQRTHWRLETDGDKIAWLHFDKAGAGTNTLSGEVLEELDARLEEVLAARPAGLVILSDKKSGFIAGADITEFTEVKNVHGAREIIDRGQRVFNNLAALPFPTVALIHGFCLGGGTELALACRYRVVEDDPGTQMGLPEVKLGIHPGFGGTVRLPPLIGAPAALNMMLSGRAVRGRACAKLGLADFAVPRRHMHEAARRLIVQSPPPHKPGRWVALAGHALARPLVAHLTRKKLAAKISATHYPAPFAIIELWKKHADDHRRMMEAEAESISKLIIGGGAQNLVRVFFLQERLKKVGRDAPRLPFEHVHVIGGGVMGGDIAAWCALRGLRVSVQDTNPQALARVLKRAGELFKKRLRQPRLVQAALDRLIPDPEGNGISGADVLIEAIFENLDAKRALFRDLEGRARADALLATNTSSIPLEDIGRGLKNPRRLVGVHFFNPVAKMQLVEIVLGKDTADEVARRAAAFAGHIGRLPVPVKSAPGFLVNRILMPYLMEAVTLETEGVPGPVIDRAATDFGMPMGPIHLADTVGLDVCLSVAENLSAALGGEVPDKLRTLVSEKHLGLKTGQGFYRYRGRDAQRPRVPGSYKAPTDLDERLMLRMLNEAVRCLREGVVGDEELLDGGVIFGTGFAPFRGGPLHYIRQSGAEKLASHLAGLESRHGERFKPDPGWKTLAD